MTPSAPTTARIDVPLKQRLAALQHRFPGLRTVSAAMVYAAHTGLDAIGVPRAEELAKHPTPVSHDSL